MQTPKRGEIAVPVTVAIARATFWPRSIGARSTAAAVVSAAAAEGSTTQQSRINTVQTGMHLERRAAICVNLFFVFGGLVSGADGILFSHKFALLGIAVPPAALVIDAGIGIDPDLAFGGTRRYLGVQ